MLPLKRLQLVFGLVVILSVGAAGCRSTPVPIPSPMGGALDDVIVCFGEGRSSNRLDENSMRLLSTWTATDLRVSSAGTISGTIVSNYEGPLLSSTELYRDFLIVQIWAVYTIPTPTPPAESESCYVPVLPESPVLSESLSDVTPILAQHSTTNSSTFVLSIPFRVPPLIKDGQGNATLHHIKVLMNWERVFWIDPMHPPDPGYPPPPIPTLDSAVIAYYGTAYPILLTPEPTRTPTPEGFPTPAAQIIGAQILVGGSALETYVRPMIQLDQPPMALSGEFDSHYLHPDFDLFQWAAEHTQP